MMTPPELCRMSAVDLLEAIRAKRVSPVEIVEAVLARIEQVNPAINAFLDVDAEAALARARAAEAALTGGGELGLLHGLPVSIKDLEPSAGLRHTSGFVLNRDLIADYDGIVTERVKAAGGIIIGKTNTPHLGHKDMCDNLLGEPARNPWNLERTPGGSSGGAAAAVAAGLGPLAHGSDGAGSIRIPAALCGVFGFKPSFGRIPIGRIPTSGWRARTTARWRARWPTPRSSRARPRARTRATRPRSTTSRRSTRPRSRIRCRRCAGLRVAWSADFGYAAVEPEARRLAERAARRFEEFGCRVEAVDPGWDDPRAGAELSWHVSMAARAGESYDRHPQAIEPSLARMVERGRRVTGEEHGLAAQARTEFYHQARRFFEQYDLLLTPQMPLTAWPVDAWPDEIDGRPAPSIFDRLPFTFPFNLTGQPAASAPCGFASDGLPVALQIVGRWHADRLTLQAAAAFEQAAPWADAWPPMAA